MNTQNIDAGRNASGGYKVDVSRGENVDRALRRLKKALDKEGILKTMRAKRHYEKPSEKKKRLANSRRGRR